MNRKLVTVASMVGLTMGATSCAMQEKRVEKELKQPINCATAEGDLRTLGHEKAHVAKEIANGVSAITPMGLVVGLVTGTEGTQLRVATGEYNKQIDRKIAEIKTACGIK